MPMLAWYRYGSYRMDLDILLLMHIDVVKVVSALNKFTVTSNNALEQLWIANFSWCFLYVPLNMGGFSLFTIAQRFVK